MFDAKKTAEELVKLGSSRGDGWLEIDGLVIYMGPLAKAKSLRAALLVPVAAALSQAYAEGVAGAAKAASGVSSVGYDGMCYYDLSSNPLKRKERTMPDPMTKEKRAELRKLAEQFKAGLGYTVADMHMQMVSAPEMRLLLSGIEALDAAEAAKQCIPPAGETPIEGLPGHSIIIRHHPELASVEVEFAYPDTGGFVTFLADLPEMYAKETLQLKADLLDYSQQLGEMQTKLDAAEAEAGRLREVVADRDILVALATTDLSEGQVAKALGKDRVDVRTLLQASSFAGAYEADRRKAARAAQGTSDAGTGETK